MRYGSILSLMFAFVLAIGAGVVAQVWLENQRSKVAEVVVQSPNTSGRIVVASQALRFGTELSASHLREIEWPLASVPAGAFTTIAELTVGNERRMVVSAMEAGEPVLKNKITGPGQRASLSAVIDPGMKAVTIRVNDVFGVAGFVLPGDRVDVMHTFTDPGDAESKRSYTDVLLQNVKVLGIDQMADERTDRPTIAKAVTLEVDIDAAQKLTLAGAVGHLSLALRPTGTALQSPTRRVDVDVLAARTSKPDDQQLASQVTVTRALLRTNYNVPLTR